MSWLALHFDPQAMQDVCGQKAEETQVGRGLLGKL
jgi:hypothetical protein